MSAVLTLSFDAVHGPTERARWAAEWTPGTGTAEPPTIQKTKRRSLATVQARRAPRRRRAAGQAPPVRKAEVGAGRGSSCLKQRPTSGWTGGREAQFSSLLVRPCAAPLNLTVGHHARSRSLMKRCLSEGELGAHSIALPQELQAGRPLRKTTASRSAPPCSQSESRHSNGHIAVCCGRAAWGWAKGRMAGPSSPLIKLARGRPWERAERGPGHTAWPAGVRERRIGGSEMGARQGRYGQKVSQGRKRTALK